MSQAEPTTFRHGLYNGRPLAEWVPEVVQRLIAEFDPLKIILFGSVADGTEGPDSDIDLVVVVPRVGDKHRLAVAMRIAVADLPIPNDLIPTDPEEIRRRGDSLGSVLRAALRDGRVVYERP